MNTFRGTRAVLYIRVSTAKQAEHGHSLDSQRDQLTACAERYGLEVVEVVTDGGESAGSLDRPGLARARELVEAGEADVILATKGDRISRRLRDLLNLAAELAEHGACILTADGTFDTASPMGKAMTQMQGVFAELERDLARERTREGMAAAAAKGRRLGRPPVGFTSKDGRLIPDDDAGTRALAVRALALRGDGHSLRSIADVFNREGVPTGSVRAGAISGTSTPRWYAASVSRLIRGHAAA